ncbi:MAG: myo-inositol 2-dehydrogenase / D-chiro-inositol 1-dehydrogenase [Gaiellaceae bacterium]|jgi:myo-inositol 2-dehydrogenase/D-chiro-inositol 1-dehydrogenase|nr:myo-inositol 2-dehydrogenase / D-chiro-inositol 1-dehydrogenase [Gaiellaceae bacterium]
MGTVHAQNALRLDGVELVAVASTRAERAAEAGAAFGVRGCTYQELFASTDVDAVVLAARSIDHAEHACSALAAGKHLFLEKPGATTVAGQDAVRATAAAHAECIVQVGYHRRFDSRWLEAHRRVAAGAIGRPLLVVGVARDVRTPEPEDPGPAGGFLVDMASHDYDAACWFLGQEPVEAYAARQSTVYPELEELGDLDNAAVTVRFDGAGIAALHISRTCAWGHDVRVEVVGEEGSVLIGNAASASGVTLMTGADRDGFPQDYRELFADAYAAELAAFAAACRGEGPPGPDLEDDRRAVAIGVAVRASAVAGRPLEVGPDWPWPVT